MQIGGGPIRSKLSQAWKLAAAGAVLVLIAAGDVWTGKDTSLAVFYSFSVMYAGWVAGTATALAFGFAAAALLLGVGSYVGHPYASPWYFYFTVVSALVSFIIEGIIISRLRYSFDREQALARRDSLTGLANRSAFEEFLETEIRMQSRLGQPLALAYFDVDDFKTVNDSAGHAEGDRVLRSVAEIVQSTLRRTDLAARLGGDEFAIVLPATGGESARTAMEKVIARVADSSSMRGWPVTLSVGIVVFESPPHSADAALKAADTLMYEVKHRGKRGIAQRLM